jgi:ferredoxin
MPTLSIDNTTITVKPGTTILEAASQAGIVIPSLCRYKGIEPPTSCFVCAVKIEGRKGVVPSCVALAEEGMVVDSSSDTVREYRRTALELLLSEHAGDCEAPCRRICPCGMDIPEMARRIAHNDPVGAIAVIRDDLPFPGVLGHICPAPCQKGCRRAKIDTSVSIRELHRDVALKDLDSGSSGLPKPASKSGKSVGIVGAGPAGMSAAWYLIMRGHQCTIYDDHDRPGGMLAFGVPRDALPLAVLDKEIALLSRLGATFVLKTTIGTTVSLELLQQRHDAIVLAAGGRPFGESALFGVSFGPKGIVIEPETFLTSRPGVFACGAAVSAGKSAARSIGQGHSVALVIDRMLRENSAPQPHKRLFDSHCAKLRENELAGLPQRPIAITHGAPCVDTNKESVTNAGRCLGCDCLAKSACDLRRLSGDYDVDQRRYQTGERRDMVRYPVEFSVAYEPGKCILCGRCVGITDARGISPGLAFVQRGFDTRVQGPMGSTVTLAAGKALDDCVAACPTGALVRIGGNEE